MSQSLLPAWPDEVDRLLALCREQFPTAQLAADSRQVDLGDLYLAFPHEGRDGRAYCTDAVARGAAALLIEEEQDRFSLKPAAWPTSEGREIPVWRVPRLHDWAGEWAHRWYDRPSERLHLWGVTGTNGKTTISQWLAQALEANGLATGVIGTLGAGRIGSFTPTGYTTPPALLLHRLLNRFVQMGCFAATLEVSSIGVAERRLDGLRFTGAIFTNLSRDHLDYHGTMAAYAQAKRAFLFRPELDHQIFWVDDPLGGEWAKAAGAMVASGERNGSVWWVGSAGAIAALIAEAGVPVSRVVTTLAATGEPCWQGNAWQVPLALTMPGQGAAHRALLTLSAPGCFQVANGMLVLAALLAEGVPLAEACASLAFLRPPPGRMEQVAEAPYVVVDYAHTPDALARVAAALAEVARARYGRLWILFGAGGDRDPGKRPEMGAAAAAHGDVVIVTSDNPRSESPAAIAAQIVAGIPHGCRYRIELDRAAAIRLAVTEAAPEDVILIAGKGHERYQEIAGVRLPFADRAVAEAALALRSDRPSRSPLATEAEEKEPE